ncbi:MAG: folylpolyglutamate synthase/dihydrofolate synthase family protein [Candidatus Marinimicrobia bacterium]|jgi:dihydrofolate synthase/folylpolyglutamate synthase|nr:folylpolyglutamate synthase/dihydrofolate synthase family protein [Candidatus Neomarinimicrobiota bacterium]|tara:strand:- start:8414 stop:9682 length:1269 start_codon:yes stop_codon:yes gene_type:complete
MSPLSTSADFKSLLNYLYNLQRLGIKVGLQHTHALLDRCDNPQKRFQSIHIAGTNGKGSTCALIASILWESGLKVGLYTSPHLIHFNERIRVNDQHISDDEIVQFVKKHKNDIDRIESTFFETTTVMAFHHFASQNVDVAVIETGLGGRLDSTNVLKPDITVITPIALDHREILGQDILTIAGEKGGILKENIPLILAPQETVVREYILQITGENSVPVHSVNSPQNIRLLEHGTEFDYKNKSYKTPLLGEHQALNTVVGIEVAKSFAPGLKKSVINSGLQKVKWPGRLQRMSQEYPLYYDVAHNAHGLKSILETIDNVFHQKPVGLFVMKGDKEIDLVVQTLENQFHKLILTGSKELGLLSGADLAQQLSNHGLKHFIVIDSLREALDQISGLAKKTGRPTLIFGSHYIAKEVFDKFGFLF